MLKNAVPYCLSVYRLFAGNNVSHWITFKTQPVIHTGRSQYSCRKKTPSRDAGRRTGNGRTTKSTQRHHQERTEALITHCK